MIDQLFVKVKGDLQCLDFLHAKTRKKQQMKTMRYKMLLLRLALSMAFWKKQNLKNALIYTIVALWSILKT